MDSGAWYDVKRSIWAGAFRSDWRGDLVTLPHKYTELDRSEMRLIRSRRMYALVKDLLYVRTKPLGVLLWYEKELYPNQGAGAKPFYTSALLSAPMENLWLDELAPFLQAKETLATAAALGGHLGLLQYLVYEKGVDVAGMANFTVGSSHLIMDRVASYGHLSVLRFLHEMECSGISSKALEGAMRKHHLDTIAFLFKHYPHLETPEKATLYAARFGHLGLLRYLITTRHAPCPPHVMDLAAFKGHRHIVNFLHKQKASCTPMAMDAAACAGHLEIVKFLHFNRTEGCTTLAFDAAAIHGNRPLLDFLIQHRREGGSTLAMDGAAYKGNEAMVRFLHKHRHEGCTTRAIDFAADQGHLSIVKFLLAERSEGFTYSGMIFAATCDRNDVLSYLLAHDVTKAKAVQALKKVIPHTYFREAVLPKFKAAGFPRTEHITPEALVDDAHATAAALALYDGDDEADDSGYESEETGTIGQVHYPIQGEY
ncbi:hypothetical protein SDRG_09747 [Saprolegnia diclina VS20]|uniref:Uncharacterized protein n=1 Tax=Saprolegnia diclina (strain VS20) TaxID=1156394 RepID=T0QGL6_SAPDV|nr:hypothetical protein SDRG_09747 [Saprolegnia diclina VS20]EQC32775.1 hypothetical protein SDRG_09747 [Saprolegnia diclina VS20]|eukprot:XP_008613919.1 hypothetical protein SDRG_09747 [Saprolegnia diclina VS20]